MKIAYASLLIPCSSLPQNEIEALVALYTSTGGSSGRWTNSSGWLDWEKNPCSWHGVGCNSSQSNANHVDRVVLVANSLEGEMPNDCFGQFSQLKTLDLNNNHLSGSLPEKLCGNAASTLNVLALWNNQLTGSIPSCFGSDFTSLQTLSLEINQLTGPLPPLEGLSNTLEYIWLYNNSLTGTLQALNDMKVLNTIELRSNSFSGTIPSGWCNLDTSLQNIVIWDNKLTGHIPECFGQLSSLSIMAMGSNSFTGTVPTCVCTLPSLRWLLLNTNSFFGTIPECYAQLTTLTNLQLHELPLSGSIPHSLCELTSMDLIKLYSSSLTGQIPECFGNYQNATSIDVHDNQLTGSLPDSLCEASNLQYIEYFSNKLTGTIPSCYATSFSDLLVLELQDNKLSGHMPSQWSGNLQAIVLSNNVQLQGTLPPTMFALTNLQAVVIEGTGLHGSIPSNVADAKLLEVLALAGNRLTGTIPNQLTSLSKLKNFQAPRNQLSGTLPELIGMLTQLHRLVLCGNMLSGTVPASLAQIAMNLDDIELDLNRLSCDLPSKVLEWSDLRHTAPSRKADIEILTGNLFGCPDSLVQSSYGATSHTPLYDKDKHGSSYRCGNSSYLPVLYTLLVCGLVTLTVLACSLFPRKSMDGEISSKQDKPLLVRSWWRPCLSGLLIKRNDTGGVHDSVSSLAYLSFDIVIVSLLAILMALPVLWQSPSSFTCQYLGLLTLAYKRNIAGLSGAVMGCAITVMLVILFKYCYEKPPPCTTSKHGNFSISPSISPVSSVSSRPSSHMLSVSSACSPLSTPPPTPPDSPCFRPERADLVSMEPLVLPETSLLPSFTRSPLPPTETGTNDLQEALLVADFAPKESTSSVIISGRVMPKLMLATVVCLCIAATLGPNMIYVLILVNSNSSAAMKTAAQVGISLVKVTLGCYVVPFIAVRALRLFDKTDEDMAGITRLASLYRDRVVVEIVHAATSLIFFPVGVVLVADPRCYYYYFRPRGSVTTTVYVTFCSDTNLQGECLSYDKMPIDSTFHYNFQYDGEQCVSAIFETYTPVFIATPLISAALDVLIGEFLLPLMQGLRESSYTSQYYDSLNKDLLHRDLVGSPTIWLNKQESHLRLKDGNVNLSQLYAVAVMVTRQVVERARRRLLLLMLTICTFGVGAPLVALSCLVSGVVVFIYHVHVIGRVFTLMETIKQRGMEVVDEDMKGMLYGWDGVPRGCGIALTLTTVAFWCFMSYPVIETIPQVYGAISTLALTVIFIYYQRYIHNPSTQQHVPMAN